MVWFLVFTLWTQVKVELYNGRWLSTPTIQYRNRVFILKDTTISRDSVKSIIFGIPGTKKGETAVSEDVKAILDTARAAVKRFPHAGGIILLDEGNEILHPDGTRTYRYHFQGKILKSKRKNWGNVRLYYNEERTKTRVLLARTIKPDGRVINLNKKDIKITKPSEGLVFFGKTKWLTFSLPQVEVGDVVEYAYEMEIYNPWDRKVFAPDYGFQSSEPILLSKITITVPKSETLYWASPNMPKESKDPKIIETSTFRSYIWEVHNSKPIIEEPSMPPRGEVAAHIECTNQKDWNHIFDWYANFQLKRMEITPEIKNLVDSIVKGTKSDEEKVARLYHWTQRHIRYISIKGGAGSGVSGHPASQTLKNGYGDCSDKAILFSTLLRAAGIESYPVYVGTNDEIPMLIKSVPSYYGNHVITEVDLPDKTLYLDATGYASRYPSFSPGSHGVYALNAQKREIKLVPVPKPEDNRRKYEYNLELKRDGRLRVKFKSSYTGYYEAWLKLYWGYQKKNEIPKMLSEMAHRVSPKAKLLGYKFHNLFDISKPFIMELSYELYDYPTIAGDLLIFSLPEIKERYQFSEVSLTRRKYPISYPSSQEITHKVTLKIPKGFKVEYLPEPINISTPYASYKAKYSKKGNIIIFSDDLKRWKRIIPVKNYPLYKNFLKKVSQYQERKIFLKR